MKEYKARAMKVRQNALFAECYTCSQETQHERTCEAVMIPLLFFLFFKQDCTMPMLYSAGWQPTTQQCKQIVDNCSERYEPAFSRHVVRDRDRIWGRDPAWGCFSHTHLRVVVPRPLRPELTFHSVLCFPAWTCGWAWSGFFCPHSHLVSGQRRGCTRSHADFYLITGDSRQNASFPFLEQALTWFPSLR